MSDSRIYDYVMFLKSVATMVQLDPIVIAPIRDPNDVVVLQTAIAGAAEAICTTDEDFFSAPASEFLRSVRILVFTDVDLMTRFRS
jgi:predicted nucleic acid-binding protein